jgi:hypothetical protein
MILSDSMEQESCTLEGKAIPASMSMAGGPGFEPGLTESESVVLPLDDPPFKDLPLEKPSSPL